MYNHFLKACFDVHVYFSNKHKQLGMKYLFTFESIWYRQVPDIWKSIPVLNGTNFQCFVFIK